jgi:hypothetical protein
MWVGSRPAPQNKKRILMQDFQSLIPGSDEFFARWQGQESRDLSLIYYELL